MGGVQRGYGEEVLVGLKEVLPNCSITQEGKVGFGSGFIQPGRRTTDPRWGHPTLTLLGGGERALWGALEPKQHIFCGGGRAWRLWESLIHIPPRHRWGSQELLCQDAWCEWDLPWDEGGSGHCLAVLDETPLLCHVEFMDSTCGVADRAGEDLENTWTLSPGELSGGVVAPGLLHLAILSLYKQSESCVCILGTKSSTLKMCGLHQGCPLSPVLFVTFMDRILRHSWGKVGNLRITSLFFADDVVLHQTDASCEAAAMTVITSMVMVCCRKTFDCSHQDRVHCYSKSSSLSISGSCSWLWVTCLKWVWTGHCDDDGAELSWAEMQSFWFTSRSTFHLITMPPGYLSLEVFQACPTRGRHQGKLKLTGGIT